MASREQMLLGDGVSPALVCSWSRDAARSLSGVRPHHWLPPLGFVTILFALPAIFPALHCQLQERGENHREEKSSILFMSNDEINKASYSDPTPLTKLDWGREKQIDMNNKTTKREDTFVLLLFLVWLIYS